MNKAKKTPYQVVSYLKVSEYYKDFLMVKYGQPVLFPNMTALAVAVERYIIDNPLMKRITPFAFSDRAFHYQADYSLFDIDISTPLPEEKANFIGIVLPKTIIKHGGERVVTDSWQFSKDGAKELRQLISRDFWVTFSGFIEECFLHARCSGGKCTRENAISDFMNMYGIDMKWYETMIRYDKRYRKRLFDEIEQRRAELEEKTDRVFVYT